MRKLTSAHIAQINKLMFKTTNSYIDIFCLTAPIRTENFSMYATDVQHNINALVNFNATKDVQALHDSIMLQDTLVREYYIDVLRYIENTKLIPADNYCCI
jgi:hypothetical protein